MPKFCSQGLDFVGQDANQEALGSKDAPKSFQLQVKPVNHPLLSCFALAAGFQNADSASSDNLEFGVAVQNFLPAQLPVQKVEVGFFESATAPKPNLSL